MPHENPSSEPTFGYLSTVHAAEHGYFGGYLIVSALGRPLEFHCTSPVRPSRAQEILYGPTLAPYLLGEQIGGTLVGAAKLSPRLVLTDQPAMLVGRPRAGVPMALVLARVVDQGPALIQRDSADSGAIASTAGGNGAWRQTCCGKFSVDEYELQLAPGFESEEDMVVESIALISKHVDLIEPFGRIHAAIREAQRIGARNLDAHDP